VQIVSGGVTNVGRVRTNNEDSFRVIDSLNLYILSDGMGGEAHGEIASAMAVDVVAKHCAETEVDPAMTIFADMPSAWSEKTRRLSSAVHLANKSIFDSAQTHEEQRGMGATITTAWIDGTRLSIAHVGDSRAYLLRSGSLQQLTSDHSLVAEQVRRGILTPAEAERSDMQSVLLRALGAHAEIEVDSEEHTLFGGDVLLLCSDGLTRMITEPEIAGTLQAEPDPTKAAERLIDLANEQGGADNITAIVVRIGDEPKSWFSWLWGGSKKSNSPNGSAGGK
jgi:serine/threonine protein phosphatase PrpC